MEQNKKTTLKIIAVTAVITCLLTNTIRDVNYTRNNGKVNNKVKLIAELIDKYSLYDIDEDKMADYAAAGVAYSVGDHYTNYYGKNEFSSFNTNLSNDFYGIGIVISVDTKKNKLMVVSPVEGGPSAEAGILPGDYIVAVDGVEYTGNDLGEAAPAIRGDNLKDRIGTKVTITVERDGSYIDYTITRDIITLNSVIGKRLDNDIGYIRITAFNSAENEETKDTYDEFKETLKDLESNGIKSLIIDLRNNPGGNLAVVTKIADELLPYGIITYTVQKDGTRQDYYSSDGELNIPMVVLVNGASASASEVLTGALKDYQKATVVGEKTFGKGVVQTVIPLSDGSGLSLTTSKYYSPNGVCIHGMGIEPDVLVEADESVQISDLAVEDDVQLQKAIEILTK